MAELLTAATRMSIAELSPALSAPSTRSFRAIVTLIWPYSSSNSSLTVLLAEPDFRLRRTRGQVRVQFTGSSARFVFEAGIGSGDEVVISLEGAEWVKDESNVQAQTPGRCIEWDLKYSERLLLQIQQSETQKISLLDIDHPAPKPQVECTDVFSTSEPELATLDPTVTSIQRPKPIRSETNEWASPAFIKRARVSYGSLFESRYDIFAEDDGSIQGKGRKRTRFSRESGSWRYSSRSPSPTVKDVDEDMNEADLPEPKKEDKPSMTDEGCQTLDSEGDVAVDRLRSLSAQGMGIQQKNASQDGMIVQNITTQISKSGYGEAGVDRMVLPPKSNAILEVEAQAAADSQQVFEDGGTITPLSPQLNPVSSDYLPLVSPLISSAPEVLNMPQFETVADANGGRGWFEQPDPSSREVIAPEESTETDDIYGVSPATHSSRHDAQASESVKLSVTNHDGTQTMPLEGYQNPEDQYGHWQSEIAAQEQIGHPTSPLESGDFPKETYPEPDVMEEQQDRLHAGPYYGDNRARPPLSTNSHTLQKQMSHGSIAMSRSQSARSEIVDLTEDSDDDAQTHDFSDDMRLSRWETQKKLEEQHRDFLGEFGEESEAEEDRYDEGSSNERQIDTLQYHEDLYMNESEAEDEVKEFSDNMRMSNEQHVAQQHYQERLLTEESGEEEDEERSYDEDEGSAEEFDEGEPVEDYLQGFRPVNDDESEELYDEEEEDVSYDDENLSEEAGNVTAMKMSRGEPEVIDLLSSDEEDVGDDTISRRSRELEDKHVPMDSRPYFEDESDSEMDADAELEDEEVDDEEGVSQNGDSVDKARAMQPEGEIEQGSKSTISELIGSSSSPEPDEADAEAAEARLRIAQQSINLDVTNEHHQHHHMGTRSGTHLPSIRPHNASGGMDGAADIFVDTKGLYPALSLDKVAGEESSTSPRPTSSGFINPEPSNQECSNKYFSDPEHIRQNSITPEPIIQVNVSHMPLGEGHHSGERVAEKHANEEHARTEPITRATLMENFPNNESIDQLHDWRDPSGDDKVVVEKDHFNGANDQQLPTPDATQLTATLGPELSFHSDAVAEPRTPPRLAVTSVNGKPITDVTNSPSASMDGGSSPDTYDASAELALSVLDSPSKESRKGAPLSNIALRVKLTRPLQTTLGAFTPLKLVRFHLEQKLDVIVLAVTQPPEPQRAKSGARHYHVRFNIVDASISLSGVMGVQIFRPYKSALPTIKPGDGVLLRNFVVKAEARNGFVLRSDEGSSWVVFKDNGEEEVRGPPVEYGDGEREHVANLKTWFQGLDDKSRQKLDKVNGNKGSEGLKGVRKGL